MESLERHILAGQFRAASQRYGAYNLLPDATVVVNVDGVILFANAVAYHLFARWPGTLPGVQVEDLVPEALREAHRQHRAAYVGAPQVRPMAAGRALSALREDGTEIEVQIALAPDTVDGQPVIVAVIRDMQHWPR